MSGVPSVGLGRGVGFVAVAGPHQEPVKTLIGQVHIDPVSVFLGIGFDPSFLVVIIQTQA